jgi:hypothetical protein
MERPTCKTCPYWQETHMDPDEGMKGDCQRYPPLIPYLEGDFDDDNASYPITRADQTCGEHPGFPAYIASLKPAEFSGNSMLDKLLKTVEKS